MKRLPNQKFIIAVLALVGIFFCLILGKLTGGESITAIGLTLGFFGTANVLSKKYLAPSDGAEK